MEKLFPERARLVSLVASPCRSLVRCSGLFMPGHWEVGSIGPSGANGWCDIGQDIGATRGCPNGKTGPTGAGKKDLLF